jgi:thiaminase/transcriptional activator TenA
MSGERMPSEVSDASFCETLRARARSTWDAAVDHRFFSEVASDALAEDVFVRYLRIEYGFIDTAAAALGYAVAKAPSFRERRHLALNLYGLVTDQERFFVGAFDRVNAPYDQRHGLPPQGESAGLHELFRSVASAESYEEILACFLGAEWLYLTWCSRANRAPSSRPAIRGWVALHAGGSFADGVDWLRSELDARGPRLTPARQARLGDLFERALAAEIPFHTAAYG